MNIKQSWLARFVYVYLVIIIIFSGNTTGLAMAGTTLNMEEEGPNSESVREILSDEATIPDAPSVSAESRSGQIALSWNPVAGATAYHVKRGTQSTGPFEVVAADLTETEYIDTSLTLDLTYYYVVTASNTAGESAPSNIVSAVAYTRDVTAPEWQNGKLEATSIGTTSVTLSWSGAADAVGIAGYKIYIINGVIRTEEASVDEGTTNYEVTGLKANTSYTFAVEARDAAGNWSADGPTLTLRTRSASGSSGSPPSVPSDTEEEEQPDKPSEPSGLTEKPDSSVLPDEVVQMNIAEGAVITQSMINGQQTTVVSIDGDKLVQAFNTSTNTSTVTLQVESLTPAIQVIFPAAAVLEAAERNGAEIWLHWDSVAYRLPLRLMKGISYDGEMAVTISRVQDNTALHVKQAAERAGVTNLLPSAYEFIVQVNGEPVTDYRGNYVERILPLNNGLHKDLMTAVWVDDSGNMRFVPSIFTAADGLLEVTVRSLNNGIFTVIQTTKTFTDIQEHWARTDIELLANKLIVYGTGDEGFSPDKNITRAEFAALLVRSLGLSEPPGSTVGFSDITATDWFAGPVMTAHWAGIISGYDDGTFQPNEAITREQMAVMLIRAISVGGRYVSVDESVLDAFDDQASIADWARRATAQMVTAGIIQGTTSNTFAAKANATRAQSVTMLKRMLQYLNFIN